MKEQMMTLSDLGRILNYSDIRSTEVWCRKNKIPIVIAGKIKYVPPFFVDGFFKQSVRNYVYANFSNSNEILDAIESNSSIPFPNSLDTKKTTSNRKVSKNQNRSEATQQFLSNLNSPKHGTTKGPQ